MRTSYFNAGEAVIVAVVRTKCGAVNNLVVFVRIEGLLNGIELARMMMVKRKVNCAFILMHWPLLRKVGEEEGGLEIDGVMPMDDRHGMIGCRLSIGQDCSARGRFGIGSERAEICRW